VGPRFDDARAAGPSQRVADAERQLGGSRVGEPVIEPVEETPEAAAAVDDEAPLPALAPPERATQGPSFVEPTRQPDDQPPP